MRDEKFRERPGYENIPGTIEHFAKVSRYWTWDRCMVALHTYSWLDEDDRSITRETYLRKLFADGARVLDGIGVLSGFNFIHDASGRVIQEHFPTKIGLAFMRYLGDLYAQGLIE